MVSPATIKTKPSNHDEQDTQFELGSETPVALAVWNGEEKDVNGKKSVSAWVNVAVENIPGAASGSSGPTIETTKVVLGAPSQTEVVETSNEALWALIGGLAVIVGLLIFVPAAIFVTDRRKRA